MKKLNRESATPRLPPSFKNAPAPAPYFHPLF